jgi:hypothetical protein
VVDRLRDPLAADDGAVAADAAQAALHGRLTESSSTVISGIGRSRKKHTPARLMSRRRASLRPPRDVHRDGEVDARRATTVRRSLQDRSCFPLCGLEGVVGMRGRVG